MVAADRKDGFFVFFFVFFLRETWPQRPGARWIFRHSGSGDWLKIVENFRATVAKIIKIIDKSQI